MLVNPEQKRLQRRQRYYRRKEEGRCVNCGSPERVPGKLTCAKCRERARKRGLAYARKLRQRAYEAYGGARCACCGETEQCFLTIDHIDGGGNQHRREISSNKRGAHIYEWLRDNNYPSGFQVLCQNCNVGRWRNGGLCVHQQEKATHAPSENTCRIAH